MRRRDAYLSLTLVAVLAGLGWFAFGRARTPVSIGDGSSDGAEDATAPDALDGSGEGGLAGGGGGRPKPKPPKPVAAVPTFPRSDGVFGRITDARETPIPGARVTLERLDPANANWWASDGEPTSTADAGADGAYLVGPMTPGAFRWRVRVEAPGFARDGADVPSKGARVDVHLDRGGSLDVRVKSATGAPIAKALVRAGDDEPVKRVTGLTDADGKIRLEGLPLGGVPVAAECVGYASTMSNDAVVSAATIAEKTLVLNAAIHLTGRVTRDPGDEPVAGATVTTSGQAGSSGPVSGARTDAEGRFALDALGRAGTRVEITAQKAGLGTASTWVQLQAPTGGAGPGGAGATDVLLRLGASTGLSGTVVDAESRPVANAAVAFANSQGGMRGVSQAPARTDVEGRFTLDLPPGFNRDGAYVIAAYAPEKGLGVATITPSKTPTVIVRLLGAGSVMGTVRAPEGDGAEGATIQLFPDGRGHAELPPASGEFDPSQYQRASHDARLATYSASADAEGRFRVESVPTGAYQAWVSWRGIQIGAPAVLSVRPGGTATFEVTLKSGSVIEGRVTDTDGKPVAGAQVDGSDRRPEQPNENRSARARTDAEGRFILRNVLGETWALQVEAPGFLSASIATVKVGDKAVEVRLTPLGWIDGVVLGPDGKPYADTFDASAQPSARAGGNEDDERGGASDSFSGADGAFRLRGLAAGEYVVSVTTSDGLVPVLSPTVLVVNGAGAAPIEVRLTAGAAVRGIVVDEATRRPLSGTRVVLQIQGEAASGGQTSSWNSTDGKGRFAALGLAAGTYTLSATDATGGSYEETLTLGAGQAVEREIGTRRPGQIAVRVVDVDGHPVPRARVMLRNAAGVMIQPNWEALRRENRVDVGRGGWDRAMSTDDDGRLTRWHVPPGRVEVMVRSRTTPMKHEPVTVAVASDRTTEITVTMSPEGGAGR